MEEENSTRIEISRYNDREVTVNSFIRHMSGLRLTLSGFPVSGSGDDDSVAACTELVTEMVQFQNSRRISR